MNIKTLLFSLLAVFLVASCNKDDDLVEASPNQLEDDIALIEAYLDEQGLVAQSKESGIYFIIDEEGTGTDYPEETSDVIIYYKGYLLDGTVFDRQDTNGDPFITNLQAVIEGWRKGVTCFKKGAKGSIFIPSTLAYGAIGSSPSIAPNTPIAFDIELVNFN